MARVGVRERDPSYGCAGVASAVGACSDVPEVRAAATSWKRASASSAVGRSAGSLRSSSSRTGVSRPAFRGGGSGSVITACRVLMVVVRWNGDWPSTAAYSVAPSDHRSDSGPGRWPMTRSGAM